ncbi:MAG: DUF4091 domain-containing protein [Clostridia bacterium]|nr:DUF4091 domain-containing protein [Clostridia bacterium]
MINTKLISSMEKCFLDEDLSTKFALDRDAILSDERYSFQLGIYDDGPESGTSLTVEIDSPLADCITLYKIESVPVRFPMYRKLNPDFYDNFCRLTPGLYPDIMRPYKDYGVFKILTEELNSLWVEVDPRGAYPAGTYPITIRLRNVANGTLEAENTFTLEILAAKLPPQTMLYTEWFHTDCLSVYYDAPVFSEKYWKIVESFMKNAVRNGINLILTPTFTLALDTDIGGERPTVQLVDVTVTNGEYAFSFDHLERWINLAHACGIENFEIAHFFTQWGAKHAPKVMATVDGEYKRIFGWDTDATGPEYTAFLRQFVTELLQFLRARGIDKNCYFHISDEPGRDCLPEYSAAKDIVRDLLADYVIMDACSSYELYESGALESPIPCVDSAAKFIAHDVPDLRVYYCCVQYVGVSNRFMAMPLDRTRAIGYQFYKFNIAGFLQWGYNFYFTRGSSYAVDPYLNTDGDHMAPAGDCFSVYPGPDGQAIDSIRASAFFDALQDCRAMKLAESLVGREAVMNAIEGDLSEDEKITFVRYPHGPEWMHRTRAKINALIRDNI